jgi:NAD(P)-dependent dehydrogenase (short-subunit alcohol dehydrogenase family)
MSEARVRDKVALVSGGGSGIGRATAALLAAEGATVFVADINEKAAQSVAAQIAAAGGEAEALPLDVSDEAAWQKATEQILGSHGRLDIVVNNAGVSFTKPVAEMTLTEWHHVLAVNLDGVFLGTKYGISAMQGRGGSIVNVASVSGITPFPGAGAYGASKAAIRLLSRIAAIECADASNGVRINVVSPGGVKTPLWETMDFFRELVAKHGGTEEAFTAMGASATASQQFISAEEVARSILYLASDESVHLTGVELILDRGHSG